MEILLTETLDLFATPDKPAQTSLRRPGRSAPGKANKTADRKLADRKVADRKVADRKIAADGVDHLAATRKLHWRLRKARSHSPEEMKAGRLICQHLLAMLDEAKNDPGPELHPAGRKAQQN